MSAAHPGPAPRTAQGPGAQQASAAMRSSLQAGKSTAQAQGLGDVFSQFRAFTDRARESAERRRALKDTGYSAYGPMNYGGGT